jgi:hypothetical protein
MKDIIYLAINVNWGGLFTLVVCFVTLYVERLPLATHQYFKETEQKFVWIRRITLVKGGAEPARR